MAGRRVLAAAVLAGLGVAGCAGPAGTGSARRPVTAAWLSGVSARSADDAWAVGGFSHAGGSAPLAEHWNGHVWKPVHAGLNNWLDDDDLTGVAATSAARAWTVGTMESQYAWPLTDQWDGRSWTQDPFSMPGVDFGDAWLAGVAVASRKDAWAVGGYGADSGATRTLILRWKGQGWDQVRSPSPAGGGSAAVSQLHAVAALSPVNAWAVGEANTGRGRSARWATVIEHWNGTRWTTVGSPDPSRAGCASDRLSGVAASRGGTWAVGSYCGAPLVLQLTGGRWRQVPCPGTPAGIPARGASAKPGRRHISRPRRRQRGIPGRRMGGRAG